MNVWGLMFGKFKWQSEPPKEFCLNWRLPWGAIAKTCSLAFCTVICLFWWSKCFKSHLHKFFSQNGCLGRNHINVTEVLVKDPSRSLPELFVFVSPTVCPTTKALKMERKKEATYVSVPHPASPALWETHDVSLWIIFYFSFIFIAAIFLLTIGDLVTDNSRVCQLSSAQCPVA